VIQLDDATTILNDYLHTLGVSVTPPPPAGTPNDKLILPSGMGAKRIVKSYLKKLPKSIAEGGRHSAMLRYAGLLHAVGYPDDIIEERLIVFDNERCTPPKNNEPERQDIIKYVSQFPTGLPNGIVDDFIDKSGSRYLTEVSASDKFYEEIKDDCLWNNSTKRWHIWNGKSWEVDTRNVVLKRAKKFVRGLYAGVSGIKDLHADALNAYIRDVKRLNRKVSVSDIVTLTSYQLTKLSCDFDSNPHLFNLQNGVIEFTRGGYTFRPHSKEDMCSLIGNVEYNPDAPIPPIWLNHIKMIFSGDTALINNVQEILGYTLDGGNPHEYITIMTGAGRNGKSVTLRVVEHILGDYSLIVNPLTLMREGNKLVSPERIKMRNKKLIVAQEPEGQSESTHKKDVTILDTTFLKTISGGDPISARELYANTLDNFVVTGLVVFATNKLPQVTDSSIAFWDRMMLIPFGYIIPESFRIDHFDDELNKSAPGILNWLLKGLMRTKTGRIDRCIAIKTAVSEYRETTDGYAAFMFACVEPDTPDKGVPARKLYALYYDYQTTKGKPIQNEIIFARDMGKRLNKKRTEDGVVYLGIKIVEVQKTL